MAGEISRRSSAAEGVRKRWRRRGRRRRRTE